MPDWTYHTVLRPAASLLPSDRVRPLVLSSLAAIARLPGGGAFIDFLGHMDPPAAVARHDAAGMDVASPIVLGPGVDPDGIAVEAFARFGFGAIMVERPEGLNGRPVNVRNVRILGRGSDPAIRHSRASSPREILAELDSGASLVMVDSGFVEGGPGLVKRTNEALAGRLEQTRTALPAWRMGWPWIALLGAGMTIAGLVVLAVGLTRVTLPYDESFLGLSHDAIAALNPHLLAFMKHDRVTLAGTMVSLGILYAALAVFGMRRGSRWARSATIVSGAVGFASLFLFLGFHYVDPLHITLALVLFPLFLAGVFLPTHVRWPPSLDLDNDRVWRAALWGQLYLIALGAGLAIAGVVIASVGVTAVFVWSDLQFLNATSDTLSRANAHLLPLIAHDRAGFGGALASDGVGVMLLALWGFSRGARWVWWTLLVAGSAGFLGGVYAHLAVGYLEFGHLLPVAVSGVVFIAGLALSAPYLLARRW